MLKVKFPPSGVRIPELEGDGEGEGKRCCCWPPGCPMVPLDAGIYWPWATWLLPMPGCCEGGAGGLCMVPGAPRGRVVVSPPCCCCFNILRWRLERHCSGVKRPKHYTQLLHNKHIKAKNEQKNLVTNWLCQMLTRTTALIPLTLISDVEDAAENKFLLINFPGLFFPQILFVSCNEQAPDFVFH